MASLPIMRMNWRRRRANSLQSIRSPPPLQPRLRRIYLPAKRQQLLENDLCRDPDELDQFCIGLFVGFIPVRIIAGGPRDLREVPDYLADIAVQGLEIGNMSSAQAVQKTGAPQRQRIGTAVERLLVVRQQGF